MLKDLFWAFFFNIKFKFVPEMAQMWPSFTTAKEEKTKDTFENMRIYP